MLIGLVGRRGTGKDTVARHLVASYNFTHRKFSRPLKNALKALFGLTDKHVEGELKEVNHPVWGVSPRKMMQFFGTFIMQTQLRALMPDIGKEHAVQRLMMDLDADPTSANKNTVISDVRFQHEVDALLKRGAVLIFLHRSDHLLRDQVTDAHESEAGVDDLFSHLQINNDSSVEMLLSKVDELITKLFE